MGVSSSSSLAGAGSGSSSSSSLSQCKTVLFPASIRQTIVYDTNPGSATYGDILAFGLLGYAPGCAYVTVAIAPVGNIRIPPWLPNAVIPVNAKGLWDYEANINNLIALSRPLIGQPLPCDTTYNVVVTCLDANENELGVCGESQIFLPCWSSSSSSSSAATVSSSSSSAVPCSIAIAASVTGTAAGTSPPGTFSVSGTATGCSSVNVVASVGSHTTSGNATVNSSTGAWTAVLTNTQKWPCGTLLGLVAVCASGACSEDATAALTCTSSSSSSSSSRHSSSSSHRHSSSSSSVTIPSAPSLILSSSSSLDVVSSSSSPNTSSSSLGPGGVSSSSSSGAASSSSSSTCSIWCVLGLFFFVALPLSAYLSAAAFCYLEGTALAVAGGVLTAILGVAIGACGICCLWPFLIAGCVLSLAADAVAWIYDGPPGCWVSGLSLLIGVIIMAVSFAIICKGNVRQGD